MIIEFTCSNHRSISNPVTFSAVASSDEYLADNIINQSNINLLKTSVIYGANGSGKSNLLSALQYMQELVVNSVNNQPGDGIVQFPHKKRGQSIPSDYSIQFTIDEIRFVYSFSVSHSVIVTESLYYFPNGRQAKIFDRNDLNYTVGSHFNKRDFASAKQVLKQNRLLLSCIANFANVSVIDDVFRFFRDTLVIYTSDFIDNWIGYSLNQIQTNENVKKIVIDFLNEMQIPVQDILVKNESIENSLSIDSLPPFLSDEFKRDILEARLQSARLIFDGFSTDFFGEESSGVKKLIGMLCPILDIIKKNKVLVADEIETSLHESIALAIVQLFNSSVSSSQLIFTTHDTSLLTPKLFRRDQIWFTEMSNDRNTDFYSLIEFNGVRKNEDFAKNYIDGKYGAIPVLNPSFMNLFAGE